MTNGSRSLRIAFLLPSFPELSNSFVIEQVVGVLERGHQVDLFARSHKSFAGLPPALEEFGLEQRMRHLRVPSGRIARIKSAARLLAQAKGLHRAHLDALNPWRHGRRALKLLQFHTAASFLRSGPYDVLHCHFGQLGIIGDRLVQSGAVDAALVTAFRGADMSSHYPRDPKRFRGLFRNGDLHLPVSAEVERRLIAAGVPRDRVVLHHDGIDLRRFPFVERTVPNGLFKLLFVGRLVEKKGVGYALEAMAKLLRSGCNAKMTIIGDGPLRLPLEALSQELGISEHVVFAGPQPLDVVSQAMQEAHAFLAPSVTAANGDQEGIPTVLKEAMAVGLPVVSTWHSGIPELVDHGVTGYLAPERDSETLTRHLATLLDQSENWAEMARAGREKVEAEFDTERLNDALIERYNEAVARRKARNRR